jgi:hypothetical protein
MASKGCEETQRIGSALAGLVARYLREPIGTDERITPHFEAVDRPPEGDLNHAKLADQN